MTVSTETKDVSYAGNGATTSFAVPFYILLESHINVILRASSGAESVKSLNTDYTVANAGTNPSTASITCTTFIPAIGETLLIKRNVPLTQETDYVENDSFPAESHEKALDKLTMLIQQVNGEAGRALRIPATSAASTELPNPSANKVITVNSSATGFQYSDYVPSVAAGNWPVISSIASLRLQDKTAISNAFVSGYYAAGDGGGGHYYYDAADTTSTDNGGTIIVGADGGRWKLLHKGIISAKQGGAKIDGATNDKTVLDTLLALPSLTVVFPAGACSAPSLAIPSGASVVFLPGFSFTGAGITNAGKTESPIDWSSGLPYPVGAVVLRSGIKYEAISQTYGDDPATEFSKWRKLSNLTVIKDGKRARVEYGSATSVNIRMTNASMDGFRFHGSNTANGPAFPLQNQTTTCSTSTDLGAESAVATENWYAIFLCANSTDQYAVPKLMPFLRVGSIVTNTITLNKAGEGIHTVVGKSYSWSATDNLAGLPCLVINETISGRTNAFSGRLTSVTSNTATTVTLADVGAMTVGDYFLVAPPSYTHYVYVGAFYFDTTEVRNIADTGSTVKAKMIAQQSLTGSGSVSSTAVPVFGYISPLATGVILDSTLTLSTSSTGDYAEYYDIDGAAHTVESVYMGKEGTGANLTVVVNGITIPFAFAQKFWFSNGGSLVASRTGATLQITGWVEV